jgi:hypothetical protein
VFASAEFGGAVDWYSTPIGFTLLAIVALSRLERRRRQRPTKTREIIAAEYIAMGMIVAPSLAETIFDAPAFGAAAITGGAILAVWGGLTQVRRRLAFGTIGIMLAIVLLIGIPITRVVTRPRADSGAGPIALWLCLAAAGVVALSVAAMIEEGRRRVRRAVLRIGELTEGWE